jgi:predicted transcriptional regulator
MFTPLELDIMKAVWEKPPVTVRTVQAAIRPARHLAYTTVMTTMDRMFKKGFLIRKLKSRAHVYEPAVPYSEVREAEVDRLIQDYFAGSKEKLIDFLDGEPSDGSYESVKPIESIPPHTELDETLL